MKKAPTKAMSPLPKKETLFTFSEALQIMHDGGEVHKKEWGDRGFYGCFVDDILMIHKPDGKMYQWILSKGDLVGDDYIVLKGVIA